MKKTRKSRGGYTLVELIVVLAITAVLAGASVMGLFAYIRHTDFKRQNDVAESLFISLQLALTEYTQTGRNGELISAAAAGGELDLSIITLPDGSVPDAQSVWGDARSAYRGRIYSLRVGAGDYTRYSDGTLDDPAAIAFFELCDAYVYDKSLLDAAICLEFDPEEGLAYSVFYSDAAQFTVYADGDGGNDSDGNGGSVDIRDRRQDTRRELMLGYYGVLTLSHSTDTEAEKPTLSNITLDPGNELRLSFRLDKVSEALEALTYEIGVYDAADGAQLFTVVFNSQSDSTGVSRPRALSSAGTHVILASVTFPSGRSTNAYFPAWIDSSGYISLVLDAADLGADVAGYLNGRRGRAGLENTFSLHRFEYAAGRDFFNIYCTVQGSGSGYKDTSVKRSNTSSAYFGKSTASGGGDAYTLSNARHLNNVRFAEASYGAYKERTYSLSTNFSWKSFIASGHLYLDNRTLLVPGGITPYSGNTLTVSPADAASTAFVPVSALGTKATLCSSGSVKYTISGLYIETDGDAGLFLRNNGRIYRIVLDAIRVSGLSNVGAVCAVNAGSLEQIEIANSAGTSRIDGFSSVGGLVGEHDDGGSYIKLVNRAEVRGVYDVGGIVGAIETPGARGDRVLATVNACRGYGVVHGIADENGRRDTENIGGIVGRISAETLSRYSVVTSSVNIVGCTASEEYDVGSLFEQTADGTVLSDTGKSYLIGSNIGGIVGYNDGGEIGGCNTVSESGHDGYVIGNSFVGGIVGYNIGGIMPLDGGGQSNQSTVIGNSFVGGICGVNASFDSDGELSNIYRQNYTVKNWINEGVVIAFEKYAGGIVGYNSGLISDCAANVDYGRITGAAARLVCNDNEFAGGIAGYNSGAITLSQGSTAATAVVIVSGGIYVGGIVGHNDIGAELDAYTLAGGSVRGDTFVGGIIGLNNEENFIDITHKLTACPNNVRGRYCVGGIIGANIITPSQNKSTSCNVYNILGAVEGEQFVGGIIGLNLLADDQKYYFGAPSAVRIIYDICGDSLPTTATAESISAIFNRTIGTYNEKLSRTVLTLTLSPILALRAVQAAGYRYGDGCGYAIAETLAFGFGDDFAANASLADEVGEECRSDCVMTITDGAVELRSVAARVYTGGFIGFNTDTTYLHLKNLTNRTPVSASESIAVGDERFSYVGGAVGCVGVSTVLEKCRNAGAGESITAHDATYLGGLAEVNRGLILSCSAVDVGQGSKDNVGGIVGLNLGTGSGDFGRDRYAAADVGNTGSQPYREGQNRLRRGIYGCDVCCTVTGDNRVGGIAAVNQGVIYSPMLDLRLNATGSAGGEAGGVAGVNGDDGEITLTVGVRVRIVSSGDAVGGIAGTDNGSISASGGFAVYGGSSVNGRDDVGGIVGVAKGGAYNYITAEADVLASAGNAGGIIGRITGGDVTVRGCNVYGQVRAALSGNAGGIVSELPSGSSVISSAVKLPTGLIPNRQTELMSAVSAPNGIAGGIAGINRGQITDCLLIAGLKNSGGVTVKMGISAHGSTGGIAGVSSGRLLGCSVGDAHISGSVGADADIGGICGINEENGQILLSGGALYNVSVVLSGNGGRSGGVCGTNRGEIGSTSSGKALLGTVASPLDITVEDGVTYGNIGGAIGLNTGNVSSLSLYARLIGAAGDSSSPSVGYGGIVGRNEGGIETVDFNGTVYANGDSSYIACVGGVVGSNAADGVVRDCRIGTDAALRTTVQCGSSNSAYGYVGGIVGENSGSVLSCDNDILGGGDVQVINYAGHTGGIAGRNMPGATLSGETVNGKVKKLSTGAKWIVLALHYDNDCGAGGIAGFSSSGRDMSSVVNSASVYMAANGGNASIGGFIGRLENSESSDMTISKCENRGTILTNNGYSSGFVGTWKFNGGSISDSVNAGQIGAPAQVKLTYYPALSPDTGLIAVINNSAAASAGFVARFYLAGTASSANKFTADSCINTGNIYGKGSSNGGIIATMMQSTSLRVVVVDCVNTGTITANGGYIGGIVGNNSNTLGNLRLLRCRNYGKIVSNSANAAGVCASQKAPVIISHCLSTTPSNNAVSINGNPNDCYAAKESAGVTGLVQTASETGSGYDLGPAPLKLSGLTYNPSEGGYRSYLEIDSAFRKYLTGLYTTVAGVKDVTVTDTGGLVYKIDFTPTGGDALRYEVTLSVSGASISQRTGDRIEVVPGCETTLLIGLDKSYVSASVTFSVRAIYTKNSRETASGWVVAGAIKPRTPIPIPQMHFELVSTGASGNMNTKYKYRAVLDNASDYTADMGTVMVSTGFGGGDFTVSAGVSSLIQITATDNRTVTRRAVPSSPDYSASATRVVQTLIFAPSGLNSTAYADTSFRGFFGASAESLSYTLSMYRHNSSVSCEAYFTTELLGYDSVLGTVVALSVGECHVTQLGSSITSTMSDLPTGLIDASIEKRTGITVRTYLWKTQASMSYIGHEAATGNAAWRGYYTADELKQGDAHDAFFDASGNVRTGYSVQRLGNDMYRVIYSVVLAGGNDFIMQTESCYYSVSDTELASVASAFRSNKNSTQSEMTAVYAVGDAPVPGDAYVYDTADDSYKFNYSCVGGGCDVLLIGSDTLGSSETVGIIMSDTSRTPVFTDTGRGDYTSFTLNITNPGTADSSTGRTLKFSRTSSQTYKLLKRLARIASPTVGFYTDEENATTEKNNLIYNVIWSFGSSDDCAGYEITADYSSAVSASVVSRDAATARFTLDGLLRVFEKYLKFSPTHNEALLDVERLWNAGASGAGNAVAAALEILSGLDPIHFRLTLVTGDSAASMSDIMSGNAPVLYYNTAHGCSAVVNFNCLSDFGSSQIAVSVRAIADAGSVNFRNGVDGVERLLTLPVRLTVPQISHMACAGAYDVARPVSASEFVSDGVSLTMSGGYSVSGRYELTVDIVSNPTDSAPAVYTVAAADEPIVMSGSLTGGLYNLTGISDDYAGMYVRVGIRATADSNISSLWSFEEGSGTQSYVYFRLPAVRLQTPSVEESTEIVTYNSDGLIEYLSQAALRITLPTHSGGALITVIGVPVSVGTDGSSEYFTYPVYRFNISAEGTGWRVTADMSDGDGIAPDALLTDGGRDVMLPYYAVVGWGVESLRMHAVLRMENGEIILILPDCENEGSYPTSCVTVSVYPAPAGREAYGDSDLAGWYSSIEDGSRISRAVFPGELSATAVSVYAGAPVGGSDDFIYLESDKYLLCRSSDGKLYSLPGLYMADRIISRLPRTLAVTSDGTPVQLTFWSIDHVTGLGGECVMTPTP